MFFVYLLLIGIVLLGCLSPLLTFTALFQQKEWRLDRLREHLRREGWWNQLFGKVRSAIMLMYLIVFTIAIIPLFMSNGGGSAFMMAIGIAGLTSGMLVLFALMSVIQLIMRQQRMPVWTSKAMLLAGTAFILDALITTYGFGWEPISLLFPAPFLIATQPLVFICAWILIKPVDHILKKRVMDRAMKLRSHMQNATVIGIAGSVGKTTVKELISHLVQDLHPLVTPAHVNTEMGVAQWLLRQRATSYENKKLREGSKLEARSSKLLIIEMGAYRKGEIALLAKITQPTIGVMTALGSDHLALFGSEQNIIEANGELIAALPSSGHAFFYGDNNGCDQLAKRSPCSVTVAKADAGYKHPLQGRHNGYNVSLAVAVAKHLNIKNDRITELLKTFKPQAHTFNVTTERGVLLLDDTYNISPLSFDAALEWAGKQSERPRALLTSGLQETGTDENRYLTELGTKASNSVERVIFTNPHGSDIFAKAFGKPVEILSNNTERVLPGSTLLAVGRMPLSTINRLLPIS